MPRLCNLLVLLVFLVGAACNSGDVSPARSRYNHGIDLMAQGDLQLAERAFLDARNEAKGDQPVRYSAAFNLGMLHVRKADDLELSDPPGAMAELEQARSWFQDAARVRSDDTDARTNLQIVGRKLQVLADQINQGKNGLEARLDRVIEDQRGLRDQVRQLMEAVAKSGNEAEPIAFRDAFATLATSERVLMADVGTISDLASDELAGLDGQNPEEMQQKDLVRQMQLRAVNAFLQSARVSIDDTRRSLRKLDARRSHSRATSALAQLKRAREQLLDPVAALKGIAQDQQEILGNTMARSTLSKKELNMPGQEAAPQQGLPAWLSPEHLAEREGDVVDRTGEVLARFQAATSAPPPPPKEGEQPDPKAERMLEMAKLALPFLQATVTAMQGAQSNLSADALEPAQIQETEALRNLLRAIEHFSELKNLIELTYAEELGVVALLDPKASESNPALAKMPTAERAKEALEAAQRNVDRLDRMTALIAEELAQAKAQAVQGQAQAQGAGAGEDATAGIQQTYDMAEQFRAAAATSLRELVAQLDTVSKGGRLGDSAASLALAKDAEQSIEELRRIFFSIVEHLKELHRDQSETYDRTGDAQALQDDAEKAELLPPLAASQSTHAALADALAAALEQQADAASGSEDPQAKQSGEQAAAAAGEVRAALALMKTAVATLDRATKDSANMSVDLSPALEDQPLAVEHIQAAIDILEPPQDKPQDQEQQQDQDQQQEQEQEEVSKQQANKRLQEIRDREAQRRREKEEEQGAGGEAVGKDW